MDAIFGYLQENKMVLLVLISLFAWGFYRLTAKPMAEMRNKGVVPSHVRFNRRESERGDRRSSEADVFTGIERRHDRRRSRA